jgi:hypothetical protein
MTGGTPAVWLTADPRGNRIDSDSIRHLSKLGQTDLLEEIYGGRRRLLFAEDLDDEHGCARIALQLPKSAARDGALVPFLPWVCAEMGVETWRLFRERLSSRARDWYLCFCTIPPGLFQEFRPVGETSPEYRRAIKTIAKSQRRCVQQPADMRGAA